MAFGYAQIYTFILYSVFIGFGLGVVYDAFRIIRRAFYIAGKGIVTDIVYFISDILFFIIAAVVSAIFIFHVNNGRIRGIALFGSFMGFVLYYNTVGRLVCAVSDLIIRSVYRTLKFILKAVLLPIWRFAAGVADSIYTLRQTKRRIRRFKRKGC
ncbi:MAG: spore cortex biosynthesis protein YabQ [Clostridia bacterium]|nr:spore cortex biosynthesis protein YabQ [Clostridia bacterium]MBQ4602753.1 spore cortex biosynthesis protein YabQ [Clostridia bacterium]